MADPVQLHGYRYSAYNRIARLALLLKNVEHRTVEIDPFTEFADAYLMLHPFGRVPALTHGSFKLFETGAITRYVDRAFPGLLLQPKGAAELARMDQVISVIDAYAYWPMVRQVSAAQRELAGATKWYKMRVAWSRGTRVMHMIDLPVRKWLVAASLIRGAEAANAIVRGFAPSRHLHPMRRSMRVVPALLAAVLAGSMSAAHAGSYFFVGPESGTWQSYRADFSAPVDYASVRFDMQVYYCSYNTPDEGYTCTDPEETGTCTTDTDCPGPFLRRVSFDEAGIDFAFYTPRTFFDCDGEPQGGGFCGIIYEAPGIYLNWEPDLEGIDVTVTTTGGGIVPEPSAWALMIGGFGLVGGALRRRGASCRA